MPGLLAMTLETSMYTEVFYICFHSQSKKDKKTD